MAKRFHITLPPLLSAQLEAEAKKLEEPVSRIVARALRAFFSQQGAAPLPAPPTAAPPPLRDDPVDPFE
jgi:hypothetical protein